MKPRKTTYLMHRWLGLIVSLQLLAWSVGGFMFSILPLDAVRGERDMAASLYEPLAPGALSSTPDPIKETMQSMIDSGVAVGSLALVDRGSGPMWEVRDTEGAFLARLDPSTGASQPLLTPVQAEAIAKRDFAHPVAVIEVRLIESDPPTEYRSKPLPAYRVDFDHPKSPHIYVDANTGQITARRNDKWRVFDFFWMLHTMDYAGRDNFNHLLLTVFSVLAILTSGSGLGLWAWRFGSRLSRRRLAQRRRHQPSS